MPKPDLAPFAARVVGAVRGYVAKAEATLTARLDALEARLTALPAPERGAPGEPGPEGPAGKDADLETVVRLAVAAMPQAKDGDPGAEGKTGEPGPAGPAGKDVNLEDLDAVIEARLAAAVEKAVAAIPKPERGEPGETGPQGAAGKDADLEQVTAWVDAELESHIARRLSMAIAELPKVKDGADGRDGQPGAPGPAGRDSENGRDGFGLEDFDIELGEDGRTLSLRFVRGEVKVERQVRIPAMLYRGVWREGDYEPGDVVTWGGSAWHCQKAGTEKPGQSECWKLMVKEGRPGKDMRPPAPRETGPVRTR